MLQQPRHTITSLVLLIFRAQVWQMVTVGDVCHPCYLCTHICTYNAILCTHCIAKLIMDYLVCIHVINVHEEGGGGEEKLLYRYVYKQCVEMGLMQARKEV